MRYLTIKEIAEKWNITERRVQYLCKNGKIHGSEKWAGSWRIPIDAQKPSDSRTKAVKRVNSFHMPMPRRTPYISMSDLYHTPGKAEESVEALADHPEAQMLLRAEIEYSRGNIDSVYAISRDILSSHSGFFAVLGGGMLLALCAIWKADFNMWQEAKKHICEAPCKNNIDRDLIKLSIAAINSELHDTEEYPEWFKMGDFEPLPADALPTARVHYVKYLLLQAKSLALKEFEVEDIKGLGLMKNIPYIVNPMISQVVADRTVIPEIYLRLMCATSYHYSGDDELARRQIERTLDLALPDKLIAILAEHREGLDTLLDDALKRRDEELFLKYRELSRTLSYGWVTLRNRVYDKNVSLALSVREREAARLAAFGFSNPEIAKKLGISLPSAKSLIFYAMNKTGANSRFELASFV